MNSPDSTKTTFMKTNMTMSWTTSTPRQRTLKRPIWQCQEQPQLQDNDIYKIQYDVVMNNLNSKTTTFMKTNTTMSWTTPNPWQRHIWKPIWRCHEQPQLQDNDLYENQYDDVMNNLSSKTANFKKTNMTMSGTAPTPRQRPLWKLIWRCNEQLQLQDNDFYENQYDDVMNNLNFKTTTFMKTNMTMSWTTPTPSQRPL